MKKPMIMIAICVVLSLVTVVYAAGSAGSEDDPVVTKSYVDSKISELKASGSAGTSATYQAIDLKQGQSLIGVEGTEIILRSGEATAIDNGANGVSNVTEGKDLMTGNPVSVNHLLLIPRDDGRGIKATTDIWVMVRGSYTIV